MKIKRITQIFRNFWKSYSATFGFFIPQLLEKLFRNFWKLSLICIYNVYTTCAQIRNHSIIECVETATTQPQ